MPEDVHVQAIVGKMSPNRELAEYQTVDLHPVGEDGRAINYEGQVRISEPGHQGYTVPRGVVHRTRAPVRTTILMVEPAGVMPTGDDG